MFTVVGRNMFCGSKLLTLCSMFTACDRETYPSNCRVKAIESEVGTGCSNSLGNNSTPIFKTCLLMEAFPASYNFVTIVQVRAVVKSAPNFKIWLLATTRDCVVSSMKYDVATQPCASPIIVNHCCPSSMNT